jgi:hypothetical protein
MNATDVERTAVTIGFFGLKNTVFAVEEGKAPVSDGTAIDSNATLSRFSGRLETPEDSFSLTGWDEARQPSRSLPFDV